jgi:hypothetical protein
MNFVSLQNGRIINLDTIAWIDPERGKTDQGGNRSIFLMFCSISVPQKDGECHTMQLELDGEDAAAVLDALDNIGTETQEIRRVSGYPRKRHIGGEVLAQLAAAKKARKEPLTGNEFDTA